MGRPKGSKNKKKQQPSAELNGGEWLERNTEKPDIVGMPKLEPIKIPPKSQPLSNEELVDMIREDGLVYLVELFPSNRIQDEDVAAKWKECQQYFIELKRMIFKD